MADAVEAEGKAEVACDSVRGDESGLGAKPAAGEKTQTEPSGVKAEAEEAAVENEQGIRPAAEVAAAAAAAATGALDGTSPAAGEEGKEAALKNAEGTRPAAEVAAVAAEAVTGALEGASPAAGEEEKEPEVASSWAKWAPQKSAWRAGPWVSSGKQARSSEHKRPWKAEVQGADVAGEHIRAYMRENVRSNHVGGATIKIGLADFEDTVITMIRKLTEPQRKEFAEYTEVTGRKASVVWYAAWGNAERLLKVLIEAKAPIDHADGSRGRTATWEAASQGHEEIVKRLLMLRADVNAKSFDGPKAGDKKGSRH
jgi:hypothetical protein